MRLPALLWMFQISSDFYIWHTQKKLSFSRLIKCVICAVRAFCFSDSFWTFFVNQLLNVFASFSECRFNALSLDTSTLLISLNKTGLPFSFLASYMPSVDWACFLRNVFLKIVSSSGLITEVESLMLKRWVQAGDFEAYPSAVHYSGPYGWAHVSETQDLSQIVCSWESKC